MSSATVRVLLAEDDEILGRALSRTLRASGLDVALAPDGATVLAFQRDRPADVVLLDLGLPDMDGLQVLARLRAQDDDVPVIVLSGRTAEGERIAGLDLGADDYVPKPASPAELSARIRAVLRRRTAPEVRQERTGSLAVDPLAHTVTVGGQPLDLPPREYDLLAYLVRRAGRVCSREELLREVWHSSPAYQDPATVTEHVARLRRRLAAMDGAPTIATVRGVGYRLAT